MNRKEAQITAGQQHAMYRPLSLGTMSLLQQIDNKTLAALIGGSKLQLVDYDDFIIFLFVHSRDNALSRIRQIIQEGTVLDKAYDWVDSKSPIDIAEGVDYFTDTQTRAQLLTPEAVTDGKPEKKTTQGLTGSTISPQPSGTTSTSARKKSTTPHTHSSSNISTPQCTSKEEQQSGSTKTKRKPKKTSK